MDKCDVCLCSGCYLNFIYVNYNSNSTCKECLSCNGEHKYKVICEELQKIYIKGGK